ncbi:Gfo/Idh/MocA family oxidoreductase [Christensenellaceae bacterium NSJ-44]|uniref:Gfo/Idh/MocA family oxidoreductase n=1 Tax=Luoshenia tenuis TaxID=2763654 RepID=A0A926HMT2_9FIRM|nr:Gfo/Idh/MocA family oxidoreductase [Luoshenia tenuis]MBC8529473.1 Gfo/Idh/MocA family oxidoreductase [Luoshenia tenuis]
MKRVKAAIIGSGMISGIYMQNLTQTFHDVVELVGCSDLIPEKAEKRAQEYGIKVLTNEEIFNDPEIEIVLNLTYMRAHYPVTVQALEAGKHVYTEKCMSLNRDLAKKVYDLAKRKGLYVTGAPDTFLGAGLQTARKLVDNGTIGKPIAARAICVRGFPFFPEYMDSTDREYSMAAGAGILHDMGGYYMTALVNLLGPVKRVAGNFSITKDQFTYKNPDNPRYGHTVKPQAPQTISATLEFESGVVGNFLVTSVGPQGEIPQVEIIGTEGVLYCGDPNMYHGPIGLLREGAWNNPTYEIPLMFPFSEDSRGIAVADLAKAIQNGRKPRAHMDLPYHVLDVLDGMVDSARSGQYYEVPSTLERPRPFAGGTKAGVYQFDD